MTSGLHALPCNPHEMSIFHDMYFHIFCWLLGPLILCIFIFIFEEYILFKIKANCSKS